VLQVLEVPRVLLLRERRTHSTRTRSTRTRSA